MTAANRWAGPASTVGLAAGFLVAIVFEAVAVDHSWGARYWPVSGAAGTVVGLLALLRRRWPAATAMGGLAVAALGILAARLAHLPAAPGPAVALGLALLVGSAVRVLRPPAAGAVALGGLAVVAGSHFSSPSGSSGATVVTTLNAVAWLAGSGAGLWLRLRDDHARSAVEEVRREERLELARELHDVVAHHITGMVIQAQAARIVARRDPGGVAGSLTEIEAAGADAMAAMRRVVGLLRDTDDASSVSFGPEEIGEMVERFNRQGPPVDLRLPGDAATWPPEVTSTVYRIVREALTNIRRHASHAGSVVVTVGQDPHGIVVEVGDDAAPASGRGRRRGGYGLVGMRERVERLGGTLSAGPGPGAGWSVRATLPIPTREVR